MDISINTKVFCSDGMVGKVDELIIDPESYQVTYLVLEKHKLLQEIEVTIPVYIIERAEENIICRKPQPSF